MDAITIERCSPTGWKELQVLSRATFIDTYEHRNAPEHFQAYLEQAFSATQIRAELADPHSHFFFVKRGGRTVGYLKLNELAAQTEALGDHTLEIERIYVVREAKGQGFGRRMVELAEQTARSLGKSMLWLGVWEENPEAIAFYEKMGFGKFGSHTFTVGDDDQVDWLFKKML